MYTKLHNDMFPFNSHFYEGGREGGREGGKEGRSEGGREGGRVWDREGGCEAGREGGRTDNIFKERILIKNYVCVTFKSLTSNMGLVRDSHMTIHFNIFRFCSFPDQFYKRSACIKHRCNDWKAEKKHNTIDSRRRFKWIRMSKYKHSNLLINLKDPFFDTGVGPRPNLARMCG